jgi:hypothetical protein
MFNSIKNVGVSFQLLKFDVLKLNYCQSLENQMIRCLKCKLKV